MIDCSWKIELVEKALAFLGPQEMECRLCPRDCGADRTTGKTGVCRTGRQAVVSHALLHFGEEPLISGLDLQGSGTIFFSGCNLKCLFCQNYQLSWELEGREYSDEELASAMLDLQAQGALNINLVTPTHVVLPVLRALKLAFGRGLSLPIVWNSNGYEKAEVVRALEGIVDIYLPDLKYMSADISARYSSAPDYFENAAAALKEMSLSRPAVELDERQAAVKGLIVRHLVLPGCAEDSARIMGWIKENLSPCIGLSVMSQYEPCYKAPAELGRPVTRSEYARAAEAAEAVGASFLFLQPEPFAGDEHLFPDFDRDEPFRWKK